jgi:hypothetical protein
VLVAALGSVQEALVDVDEMGLFALGGVGGAGA